MFGGTGSIQLARVFGIRIGVDPSWFFVLFLIIWSLSGYYGDLFPGEDGKSFGLAVASALLFFTSVLLHEMGHALVARRNGIGIAGIDLWLFGGVAKMERDTQSAGEEFRVAVAGPVVTLLITLACYGASVAIAGSGEAADVASFGYNGTSAVLAVLGYLAFINGILLVFNMIPGFPLDGGRIARSIAWKVTGDRTRATRFAARLGRFFSYVLIGLGVFMALALGDLIGGIWLGFIGVFLGQAARQAETQSVISDRIEGIRVSDVMDAEPVAVPADLPLDRAEEEYFLRYRYPWFPVVDAEGRFVGLVTHGAIEGMPEAVRSGRTVASVMAGDGDQTSGLRVAMDADLDALLSREALARLGALMAVDPEGRLRGIVTADRVRQALHGAATAP